MAKATAAPKFKMPKTLAECADLLYATRIARLALQKQAEVKEAEERQLRERLINELPKSKALGIAGKVARATIETKPVPTVEDWDRFYQHVKKTGHFDLLHKRLSEDAVKQRWEDHKVVPGVGKFNAVKVSLEKL